jgi:phosphohistidine phosphatase
MHYRELRDRSRIPGEDGGASTACIATGGWIESCHRGKECPMSPAPLSSELLFLRHGKSDWDSGARSDFDRPLAKRGRRAADRMAQWMAEQGLFPDRIVSSAAARAHETAERVAEVLGFSAARIQLEDGLYLAGADTFLHYGLEALRGGGRVLVVGHNPGMEELVIELSGGTAQPMPNGKVFPTAALAVFAVDADRGAASAELVHLVRPREL